MKNYLIVGLMITMGFSCKAQKSTIVGVWCAVGSQNEPESEIDYYDSALKTFLFEINDKGKGFIYDTRLRDSPDTSVVITKVTSKEIVGYRKGLPHKRINKVYFDIDKLDSNELVLINRTYEGYKEFYRRCTD